MNGVKQAKPPSRREVTREKKLEQVSRVVRASWKPYTVAQICTRLQQDTGREWSLVELRSCLLELKARHVIEPNQAVPCDWSTADTWSWVPLPDRPDEWIPGRIMESRPLTGRAPEVDVDLIHAG